MKAVTINLRVVVGVGCLAIGPWFAGANAQSSDARIDAVFLAQTHVMQPDQPYFKLTGNRDALLKAHVISPSGAMAPEVFVVVMSGGTTNTFKLKGPATLPKSLPSGPGVVRHQFEDSFTAMVPAKLVRAGMQIEVRAGSSLWRSAVKVGAPTVVHMKMFDVHYFGRGTNDYPPHFLKELESKWPVARLEIERVRGINFSELVIPARDSLPAVRVEKPEDYRKEPARSSTGNRPPPCSGCGRSPARAAIATWRCATSTSSACLRAGRRAVSTGWAQSVSAS